VSTCLEPLEMWDQRIGQAPRRYTSHRPLVVAHAVLTALVGLALLAAGILISAVPAAAGNRVGASTTAVANTVGPLAGISAGQRLGKTLPQPQIVVATAVAAEGGAGRFGMLERARMGRLLNPEAGSIGGGGFTGSATAHGAERIAEAGFDDIDVALIRAGSKYEQSDGAFAYVAQAGRSGYNLIIQNADGAIVTAHRGMSYGDLAGLARNYGWAGW